MVFTQLPRYKAAVSSLVDSTPCHDMLICSAAQLGCRPAPKCHMEPVNRLKDGVLSFLGNERVPGVSSMATLATIMQVSRQVQVLHTMLRRTLKKSSARQLFVGVQIRVLRHRSPSTQQLPPMSIAQMRTRNFAHYSSFICSPKPSLITKFITVP